MTYFKKGFHIHVHLNSIYILEKVDVVIAERISNAFSTLRDVSRTNDTKRAYLVYASD